MEIRKHAYIIKCDAHEVRYPHPLGDRLYPVAAFETKLIGPDRRDVIGRAVREAHRLAKVPPYRSLLRQTAERCTVTPILVETLVR